MVKVCATRNRRKPFAGHQVAFSVLELMSEIKPKLIEIKIQILASKLPIPTKHSEIVWSVNAQFGTDVLIGILEVQTSRSEDKNGKMRVTERQSFFLYFLKLFEVISI